MSWQPTYGAWPGKDGAQFSVWALNARLVEVILKRTDGAKSVQLLQKNSDGTFGGLLPGVGPGDRYRYRVDGQGPFPDPASRFQPEGVHGPSEVIDPTRFNWTDASWRGIGLDDLIIYELHVGTFTPEGTFAGVAGRLPYLKQLGVTAVELMPVADFPGQRNWGYDGVSLFAPARCYGRPDDLRRLVDEAHRLGLGVILDVVYNHLGPDGNYLGVYSPYYFTERHHTAWGAAVNFDGEHSEPVRRFFIENALHWVHEYHVDGLRLDATHAIADDGPRHILAELAERVHGAVPGKSILVIAEDHRNLAHMVKSPASSSHPCEGGDTGGVNGWGLDAVWADDFHHQIRRLLAGDHEGYYRDFSGSTADLAATLRQGWFFCGQFSEHLGAPRGSDPAGLPPRSFVICLQNHDQIGNRALGERLHHQIDLAAYRAAVVLLLCAPATPLLFMGQEWAASSPFLYFTNHHDELGKLVTEGRRKEFRHFAAFSDPAARARIPDPQAESTFVASRLDWSECEREPHASMLRLHRTLLRLRQTEPALRSATRESFAVEALDDGTILLRRSAGPGPTLLAVCRLRGSGAVDLGGRDAVQPCAGKPWETVLTTEDAAYSPDPCPPRVDLTGRAPVMHFARPAAVLLRRPGL
ncbi:MAG: malto-oligosyltrehalose trehalohydrolase [Gemmataceae bacterium]|nr:malto-oligosyltrehalose trehalohydrolase [Gemmataceae bacterium]